MNKTTKPLPRGIRNNNPLNIRIGNVWLGEVANPTDPDFEQFVNMKYGLRAAFILLRRYINHYHRNTVPMILAAWAPSCENNTTNYIDFVCRSCAITPTQVLTYEDKVTMCRLVRAMAHYETGTELNESIISQSYDLA